MIIAQKGIVFDGCHSLENMLKFSYPLVKEEVLCLIKCLIETMV